MRVEQFWSTRIGFKLADRVLYHRGFLPSTIAPIGLMATSVYTIAVVVPIYHDRRQISAETLQGIAQIQLQINAQISELSINDLELTAEAGIVLVNFADNWQHHPAALSCLRKISESNASFTVKLTAIEALQDWLLEKSAQISYPDL
jgi:hypothetical protein